MTNHLEESRYWGPSNTAVIGVQHLNNYSKRALDLGCGSLRHSKYLFNCGYIVDAIDKDSEVVKYSNFFDHRPKELFSLTIGDYNNLDLGEDKYDIVVSENTLSFNRKVDLDSLLPRIIKSIKRNGVFAGNLYGEGDFRRDNPTMTFFTRESAYSTLSGLGHIKHFYESCDEKTAEGDALHSFQFVIIKP